MWSASSGIGLEGRGRVACVCPNAVAVRQNGRRQRCPAEPVLSGGGLFRVPEAIKIGRPPATIPSPFPTSSHPIPPPPVVAFLPALLHPHLLAPRHALTLMAEADL